MKAIIKNISLLLCSGLIIAFYYYNLPDNSLADGKQVASVVRQYKPAKSNRKFVFMKDIVALLFPVLKRFY